MLWYTDHLLTSIGNLLVLQHHSFAYSDSPSIILLADLCHKMSDTTEIEGIYGIVIFSPRVMLTR